MGCSSSKTDATTTSADSSSRRVRKDAGNNNASSKKKAGKTDTKAAVGINDGDSVVPNLSQRVNNTSGTANNSRSANMSMMNYNRYATCHFCHQQILEKDLNAHTVMCGEREVTCWNPWCRKIMKQADLHKHLEECSKQQKAICPKCGAEILAIEMQAHRDTCQPKPCPHCGEICITRIHKWCPQLILSKVKLAVGPFADEVLRAKYGLTSSESNGLVANGPKANTNTTNGGEKNNKEAMARVSYNVARMQLLWRWIKCRAMIEDIIFRSMHKEMDLKKEGFAIFKAHDKVNDSHVLAPKRSRSVIQAPVVAPAISSHYFPVNTNTPITGEHVDRLIADIKNHVLLPYPAAWRVFMDAMNHLNTLPNVVRLSPTVGARTVNGRVIHGCKVVVVGDLHGQIADLLHILAECGLPNEGNYYVFNGDFVDRGSCSVEVLLVLFALMLAFPTCVTLNRGNHECDYMNDEYGFDVEVSTKYDRNIFRLIQRCFCALPLATIVSGKIFIVHGGLPRRKGVTINDISRIQRFRQIPIPDYSQPEEDEIFQDLLWSDPVEDLTGWRESQRGAGVEFGADLTNEFLKNNDLELVVRSHEECISGYQEHHNRRLLTIFSASNYDGPDTNFGAVCTFIGDSIDPAFHTYQIDEDEYESPQMVNLVDSIALSTPNIARIMSTGGLSNTAARQLQLRRSKDDVLRELRERIYQRRHRLMLYYSKLDRTNKGSLWMIEWVEGMRNVLNLELPWYFLRSYLVEVNENSRIWYSPFLHNFHNLLQVLWVEDWKQSVCARLVQQQRANHRSRLVSTAFNKEIVNYFEFCSVLRAIDYTTSDSQLFQLFQLFDVDGVGHISGPQFIKSLQLIANAKPDPMRWDIDAMEQLQSIVIQGRSQLPNLFKVTAKEKILSREKFMAGMAQLARGMRKQLTQPQKDAIFDFMLQRSPQEDGVSFDTFLLCVYVFDSRTVSGLKMPSIADMIELGLTPFYFKNSSFSSMQQIMNGPHT